MARSASNVSAPPEVRSNSGADERERAGCLFPPEYIWSRHRLSNVGYCISCRAAPARMLAPRLTAWGSALEATRCCACPRAHTGGDRNGRKTAMLEHLGQLRVRHGLSAAHRSIACGHPSESGQGWGWGSSDRLALPCCFTLVGAAHRLLCYDSLIRTVDVSHVCPTRHCRSARKEGRHARDHVDGDHSLRTV